MVLEVVPALAVGALLVAAGIVAWIRPLRAPATHWLGAFLVTRGALNLSAGLWLIDGTAALATRLWPALDVLVAAFAFTYAERAYHHGLRTGDGPRPDFVNALRFFLYLTAIFLFLAPNFYWGRGAGDGPLFFLNGLKFVAYGIVVWVLLGPATFALASRTVVKQHLSVQGSPAARHARFLLGAALLLDLVYWNAIDGLVVATMGARLPDIRNGFDHYGRFGAIVFGLMAVGRLSAHSRFSLVPGRRPSAKWALVACMSAIAVPVVWFDLHAFGLIGAGLANLGLLIWWDALFTLPFALVVWHPWLAAPHGREATGAAEREGGKVVGSLRFPGE